MVTAVGIKGLWYAATSEVSADLTASALATILGKAKQVTNIHQDTWSIEEAEPSLTAYNNQLTKKPYRQDKQMGEVTINFTIGQYDYETKAAFMGGSATEKSWKRSREVVDINYCVIALTEDNQYCVFPKASITGRNADADGAVGIGVMATALEPDNTAVASEYWFDGEDVNVV
ncbi:MAG: hypothetical protein J1E33_03740 [Alistipes sp.]|nr:hypothetical protein [Alistipes sp.]